MTILAGTTVLIAEPSASVASGLCAIIELWGGACRTVHSPQELYDALHTPLPDLLLVNIDLAGGRENLRILARRFPIRTIGIAARFLPPDGGGFKNVMCLEMPFTIRDLQRAVISALPSNQLCKIPEILIPGSHARPAKPPSTGTKR